MKIFVCPKDWAFAKERFTPDHMVSLQNPGADVSELRPPWVTAENHYVSFFYDSDLLGDEGFQLGIQTRAQLHHHRPRGHPAEAAHRVEPQGALAADVSMKPKIIAPLDRVE